MRRGRGADQIRLVQYDDIGKGDLRARLLAFLELLIEMLRIDHRHECRPARTPRACLHRRKKFVRPARIGEAGGFQHDAIELISVA